jgi:regulator of replication initiation timing
MTEEEHLQQRIIELEAENAELRQAAKNLIAESEQLSVIVSTMRKALELMMRLNKTVASCESESGG